MVKKSPFLVVSRKFNHVHNYALKMRDFFQTPQNPTTRGRKVKLLKASETRSKIAKKGLKNDQKWSFLEPFLPPQPRPVHKNAEFWRLKFILTSKMAWKNPGPCQDDPKMGQNDP